MEDLTAIIAILSTIALPIGFGMYLGLRANNQKHVERMEMIKQGIIPPDNVYSDAKKYKSLRNGLLFVGMGIGFIVGLTIIKTMRLNEDAGFLVLGASFLLFFGLAYLAYFKIVSNKEKE
ncbi:MAG TPA: hypothetical protein PKN38_05405 [Taishania sp.]|nr:hypothetical protein [Taishania sp.]